MATDPKAASPTYTRVLVGRKEAEQMLGANIHNRYVRDRKVRNYAIDMLTGNWMETGEPLKFAGTGELLDGQHRLIAVIKAATDGITLPGGNKLEPQPDLKVWFTIAHGLDKDSQRAMDIGAPRSLADSLHLDRGETNVTTLASVIRVVHAWESGYRKQIGKRELTTNASLLAFFDKDPDLFRNLVAAVRQENKRIPLAPSVLALAHYILEDRDPEEARFFFDRLADGQGMFKGDPIYELRERLAEMRDRNGVGGHRYMAHTLALVIKAWNAFRAGEKVSILSFKMGGQHPESFPEPM
jgi:hypothetical protein